MGCGRTWTAEEKDYLTEKWGDMTISGIAKALGRTVNAVIMKVNHMGLSPYLESGDYITFNQFLIAVYGSNAGGGYKLKSWVKNRGFPIHNKRLDRKTVRVVYLDEFWKWAEKNRHFLDFSKMAPLALGKEPGWVAEQRRKDVKAYSLQRKDPWTSEEDSRLIMLLKQHKYSWAEVSDRMRRSCGAITRRCLDLGIKDRPVAAEGHGKNPTWTADDFKALADGIRNGDGYAAIGRAVGQSEKCVRSKVYDVYLTEQADKVRAMLGDGPWGTGAPEIDVKHGFYLSRTRQQVRRDLSVLDALLRKRVNDLGYDPYWQRFQCQHWDDYKGCAAGGTDCDSCAAFERIRPQYCARCGGTFFERADNRFCPACRKARKRQAQRKWRRDNAGRAAG